MDDRPPPRVKQIAYESPAGCGISRRGFRLLLLLTAINTILLGSTLCGPLLSPFVTQRWAMYQKRNADRASGAARASQRAAMLASQTACLKYSPSPETLIYAEDSAGAAQFIGLATQPSSAPAASIGPAGAALPDCFTALPRTLPGFGLLNDSRKSIVFLHERKPASDTLPLLVVAEIDSTGKQPASDLTILVLTPGSASSDLAYRAYTNYQFHRPSGVGALRFYAGQPVAGDASAFTIRYTLGDQRGEILCRIDRAGGARATSTGPLSVKLFSTGSGL